jgi:hypothetical protein
MPATRTSRVSAPPGEQAGKRVRGSREGERSLVSIPRSRPPPGLFTQVRSHVTGELACARAAFPAMRRSVLGRPRPGRTAVVDRMPEAPPSRCPPGRAGVEGSHEPHGARRDRNGRARRRSSGPQVAPPTDDRSPRTGLTGRRSAWGAARGTMEQSRSPRAARSSRPGRRPHGTGLTGTACPARSGRRCGPAHPRRHRARRSG